MKHKDTVSAVIGSMFFAVPYLALSLPVLPSLAIGVSAFCAGELVFSKTKNPSLKEANINAYKALENAKKQNKHILEMKLCIDNEEIKMYLTQIHDSTAKIIKTVEKNPEKIKNIDNFFDYYLPITVRIIDRYDEIENQNLSSKDSKKFISSASDMLEAVSKAFKNILNNLYQSEIIDMDAEMKVFSSMLKADGFDDNGIEVNKEDNNG